MPSDLLVKLYDLDFTVSDPSRLRDAGITICRAMNIDRELIVEYVSEHFSGGWRSECQAAFSQQPPTMFIAIQDKKVIGFACYDCTAKGFFGPTGVTEEARGKGVGTALLMACMEAMRNEGYVYAAIGWVTDALAFYEKTVGAIAIPDSHPGVYRRKVGVL